MKSGIYFIKKIGGKIYIGSSKNINHRLQQHFSKLKINNHSNKILQNTYNKYGKDIFKIGVLEFCEIGVLIEREQFYINSYDKDELFNLRLIAESNKGFKHSEETKKKLSENLKGNQYALGMKHTDETKLKISEKLKGNNFNLGKKVNEVTKLKLSLMRKGIPKSKEHIENSAKARTGLKRSEESKLRMSIAAKNRKLPEDYYEKRAIARKVNKQLREGVNLLHP
jgi:group I intron endonuclease